MGSLDGSSPTSGSRSTRRICGARRSSDRADPKPSRGFHTAARPPAGPEDPTTRSASRIESAAAKLERALEARENYREAGLGRVVFGEDSKVDRAPGTAAGLDVCVPPGAERLRVRVSLEGGSDDRVSKCRTADARKGKKIDDSAWKAPDKVSAETAPSQTAAVPRDRSAGSERSERHESWMSIKSLLSGYRKGDKTKKDSAPAPTCPTNTQKSNNQDSSETPSDTTVSPGKSPTKPIPCYPPFPSAIPEKPQACKSPAATSQRAPVSSTCKPLRPQPPSKFKTDYPPSKPKIDCPPSKLKTDNPTSKPKIDCPPSKPKTDYPPSKPKTDCPSSKF